MRLRPALGGDSDDVLAWRNDPEARAASRTTEPVDPAVHAAWFPRALEASDRVLLVAEEGGRKLGMVRFDAEGGDTWRVSINLAPAERGRGLGGAVLIAGVEQMERTRGALRFTAEIRQGNAASRRIFEAAGFKLEETREGFDQMARPRGEPAHR